MTKKKILIVGPISDFGGREIEVNNIVDALVSDFQVNLLSTIPMTKKSVALHKSKDFGWSTVNKKIFSSNFFILFTSLFCKIYFFRKEPSYFFIGNKFNHKFFSFQVKYKNVLKREINRHDTVIISCELTTKWLKEIVEICREYDRPLIIRTTGTIKVVPESITDVLKKVNKILVHSYSNYQKLALITPNNLALIDQTTLLEEDLDKLNLNEKSDKITYGYLGRLGKEKGIIELLNIFKQFNKKLIVAGSGPLLEAVTEICNKNPSIDFIGEISGSQIIDFYKSIDVLIIPSFEEAGPLVGIEAMAAGKIILSTKVGAMMDRLEKTRNQFWFNINDQESIIEAIAMIENLNKESLLEIRKDVRKAYKNKYSRKNIAQNYLDLVNEVVE